MSFVCFIMNICIVTTLVFSLINNSTEFESGIIHTITCGYFGGKGYYSI